jgi:hypothetical protein
MKISWDTESAYKAVNKQHKNLDALTDAIRDVRKLQGAMPGAMRGPAVAAVRGACDRLVAALQAEGRQVSTDSTELARRVTHMMEVEEDVAKYEPMSNWDIAFGTAKGTGSGLKDMFWDEPVATIKDPNASAASKAWAVFNIVTLPIPAGKVVKLGAVLKGSRVLRAGGAGTKALAGTRATKVTAAAITGSKAAKAATPAAVRVQKAATSMRDGYKATEKALTTSRAWATRRVLPVKAMNKFLARPAVVKYRRVVTRVNRMANSDLRSLGGRHRRTWGMGSTGRGQKSIDTALANKRNEDFYGNGMRDAAKHPRNKPAKDAWERGQLLEAHRGADRLAALSKNMRRDGVLRRELIDAKGHIYQERVMPGVVGHLANGKPTNLVTVRLSPAKGGTGFTLTDVHPGPMSFPKRHWAHPLPQEVRFVDFGPKLVAPKITWAVAGDDGQVSGTVDPGGVGWDPHAVAREQRDLIEKNLRWRREGMPNW